MRHALTLLKILTERIPPTVGRKHGLNLNDKGGLTLSLSIGEGWQPVGLDDADLAKEGEAMADEIHAMWKARQP